MDIIKPWLDCQTEPQYASNTADTEKGIVQIFICKKLLDEENLKIGIALNICEQCKGNINCDGYISRKIKSFKNRILADIEEVEIIRCGIRLLALTDEETVKAMLLQAAEEGYHSAEKLIRIAEGIGIDL